MLLTLLGPSHAVLEMRRITETKAKRSARARRIEIKRPKDAMPIRLS